MQVVTVKFQEKILKNIDESIDEHNFNSRTEFIREAVRDKLNELNNEDLLNQFLKFKGKAKIKTTEKQNRKTREIVSKELFSELEKRFK